MAIDFTGAASEVAISLGVGNSLTNAQTISMWVKSSDWTPGGSTDPNWLYSGNGGYEGSSWFSRSISQLGMYWTWSGNDSFCTWTHNFTADTWHNLIVVFDPSSPANWAANTNAYNDGTAMTSRVVGTPTGVENTSRDLNIGGEIGSAGSNFNGQIAHLATWNRIVTAAEIALLQHHSPLFIRSGLQAYIPGHSNLYDQEQGSVSSTIGTGVLSYVADSPRVYMPVSPQYDVPQSAASGAISGTASGSSTTSGTLTGAGALAGAASGSSTTSGTLSGAGALSGAASGASTTSGTLTGSGSLSGTASGSSSTTGTLDGAGALSGAASGSSTVSGTLTGTGSGAMTGTASGASTTSGTLTGAGALSGTASGSSTTSGTLTNLSSTGTASGSSTVTGTLTATGALAGSASGSSTVTGALTNASASALEVITVELNIDDASDIALTLVENTGLVLEI